MSWNVAKSVLNHSLKTSTNKNNNNNTNNNNKSNINNNSNSNKNNNKIKLIHEVIADQDRQIYDRSNGKLTASDIWLHGAGDYYDIVPGLKFNIKIPSCVKPASEKKLSKSMSEDKKKKPIRPVKNSTHNVKFAQSAQTAQAVHAVQKKSKPKPKLTSQFMAPIGKLETKVVIKASTTLKRNLAPRVYKVKDELLRKKEERFQEQLEIERKAREFRSRPAPKPDNFFTLSMAKRLEKSSKKRRQKIGKKQEEVDEQTPKEIKKKPFTFNVDRRIAQRKLYDETVQKANEEKLKKETKQRKKAEKKLYKQLRKQTRFKARPNPFKNY